MARHRTSSISCRLWSYEMFLSMSFLVLIIVIVRLKKLVMMGLLVYNWWHHLNALTFGMKDTRKSWYRFASDHTSLYLFLFWFYLLWLNMPNYDWSYKVKDLLKVTTSISGQNMLIVTYLSVNFDKKGQVGLWGRKLLANTLGIIKYSMKTYP